MRAVTTSTRTYRIELFPADIIRIMGALIESAKMHRLLAEGASALDPPELRAEYQLIAAHCDRIREAISHAQAEETRIP